MKLLQNTITYLETYFNSNLTQSSIYLSQSSLYKRLNHFKKELYDIYNNFNKYDVDANLPDLHRWCNRVSDIYRNTCNLEKKLDNANRDNCY